MPQEALSDTPAFLAKRRLLRRLQCGVGEAASLAEPFVALNACPAVVAHYEDETRRVGVAPGLLSPRLSLTPRDTPQLAET